jgi:hypothetical protein
MTLAAAPKPNQSAIGFIRALVMSTAEGPRKFELEKAALDAAYQAQIGEQFKAYFFATISDQCDEHDALAKFKARDERAALAKFKAASEALYRAHVHALSIFSDHNII